MPRTVKPKNTMKILTISLNKYELDILATLDELGLVPSRSEAIRQLIHYGWQAWEKDLRLMQKIKEASNVIADTNHNPYSDRVFIPRKTEDGYAYREAKVIRRLD